MKGTVSEMHLHGGWVAFAIFVFIILSLFIFGLIEDAKEKQKSKYPPTPKKERISDEKIDYIFTQIWGTLAGIIIVVVPLTILYIIAIQF